jgi:hypothetical protein
MIAFLTKPRFDLIDVIGLFVTWSVLHFILS